MIPRRSKMVSRRSKTVWRRKMARLVALGWACAGLLSSASVTGEPVYSGNPTLDVPPAQASRERARQYFLRGGEAASRRSWREAIDLYLESYVQYPHPSTLHNIGYCYYQQGDLYQALFFSARALHEVPLEDASRLSVPSERAATTHLVRLRQALGEVVLSEAVALPKPVWVYVDGTSVIQVPLGRDVRGLVPIHRARPAPVKWDSSDVLLLKEGIHEISLRDGSWHRTVRVEVRAGTRTRLHVDRWQRPAAMEGEKATISVGPAETTALERSRRRPAVSKGDVLPLRAVHQPTHLAAMDDSASGGLNAAYISWLASGGAFGFSAVAWVLARDLDEELGAACQSGRCPLTHEADVTRYDNTVLASYIGAGVGVIAAATGGVFWVLGRSSADVSLSANPRRVVLRATF